MKPTELRIGNTVHGGTVLELHENHAIVSGGFAGSHVEKYYDMVPVKLTEEWMIRFGYIKQAGKGFDSDYYHSPFSALNLHYHKSLTEDVFAFDDYRNGNGQVVWIDSVHQLQNLHYHLEGKEIEFAEMPSETNIK